MLSFVLLEQKIQSLKCPILWLIQSTGREYLVNKLLSKCRILIEWPLTGQGIRSLVFVRIARCFVKKEQIVFWCSFL